MPERATCAHQGFQGEFLWPGTNDATAWLAVPAALAVIKALGPGTQAAHARKMLAAAVPLLQASFGTTVMLGALETLSARHTVAMIQRARRNHACQCAEPKFPSKVSCGRHWTLSTALVVMAVGERLL